jgi:hypothetical protein
MENLLRDELPKQTALGVLIPLQPRSNNPRSTRQALPGKSLRFVCNVLMPVRECSDWHAMY